MSKTGRRNWQAILKRAADIVNSYDTSVTLRQLFYRLVAAQILENTRSDYNQLSRWTAEARRTGTFPDLLDRTRSIERYQTFEGPEAARHWLSRIYRRERTEGQEFSVYIGVEKEGLVNQLDLWFGDYGMPILAVKGYSSQTFVDDVRQDALRQRRPAVLIYAGDFDPSGEDIERDFEERTDCFGRVVRVALTSDQVEKYNLPPVMGKATDTRAAQFIKKHGKLVQVELDAIPPDILRDLYWQAISEVFDMSTWEQVIKREEMERKMLTL